MTMVMKWHFYRTLAMTMASSARMARPTLLSNLASLDLLAPLREVRSRIVSAWKQMNNKEKI